MPEAEYFDQVLLHIKEINQLVQIINAKDNANSGFNFRLLSRQHHYDWQLDVHSPIGKIDAIWNSDFHWPRMSKRRSLSFISLRSLCSCPANRDVVNFSRSALLAWINVNCEQLFDDYFCFVDQPLTRIMSGNPFYGLLSPRSFDSRNIFTLRGAALTAAA